LTRPNLLRSIRPKRATPCGHVPGGYSGPSNFTSRVAHSCQVSRLLMRLGWAGKSPSSVRSKDQRPSHAGAPSPGPKRREQRRHPSSARRAGRDMTRVLALGHSGPCRRQPARFRRSRNVPWIRQWRGRPGRRPPRRLPDRVLRAGSVWSPGCCSPSKPSGRPSWLSNSSKAVDLASMASWDLSRSKLLSSHRHDRDAVVEGEDSDHHGCPPVAGDSSFLPFLIVAVHSGESRWVNLQGE
jgi:hypothetical protein